MNNIRRTHSAAVCLGFLILALSLFTLASHAQRIEWELVNPFPFIHDRDSVDELRKAYSDLNDKSALALERALQRADEKRIDARRARDMAACRDKGGSESECTKKHWYPYLGWFADVARNGHAKTCWDSSALEFRKSDQCRDYFNRKSHRVRAWIEGLNDTVNIGALKWLANGGSPVNPGPCNPKYGMRACLEFDVPYSIEQSAPGQRITVMSADGSEIAATEMPIKVVDVLIAGLGDSFASGEGNPDIPAQFMTNESDRDFFYFWKWRRLPRKDKIDPTSEGVRRPTVEWLDRRCHRSMYSYQFKAALRYALEHPQRSVTFVSYACSGATTDNIFKAKGEQKAMEAMPHNSTYYRNGGRGKIELQLQALRKAIDGRPIDVLLLSSGGNDIGFSSYVAYVVTSGKTRWLIGKKPREDRIAEELDEISDNYAALWKAISDSQTGVPIRGCKDGGKCDRVVLTPYPNVFTEGRDKVCEVTRNEFTMPFNRDSGRKERTQKLFDELFVPLENFQKKVPATFGWRLADSTRDLWLGHGFCAQDTLTQSNLEERFIMPQRKKWIWKAYRPGKPNAERDLGTYEPWKYNAYASRTRWIRLPVDSKLTADQQRRLWKWSIDFLFEDDRSSVMHPTAEGHANNADANYDVIEALLH